MQMMEQVTNDKIKFEYKISDTELIFLDMNIYKDKYFKTNNILSTKLYQKENNKYLFIPPFSSHAPSIYIKSTDNRLHNPHKNTMQP